MGAILSIQSHVAYGHVGNSAVVFALQRLGREVWPIDTVQFSSHAGYPGWRGEVFSPALIGECVAGLEALGALASCDGVVTGYLGKAATGEAALAAVAAVRARNAGAVYACDPVIGDDERGIYVHAGVPEFFRDQALQVATIVSPNAFELAWLTGRPLANKADAVAALNALRARGPAVAFATSLRLEDTGDALDLIAADADGAWRVRTPKLPISVNGAGDLVSALFLHEWLVCRDTAQALASASARVYAVVAATAAAAKRELQLVAAQALLADPPLRFAPERL
jgi:pyridoxine kinase